MTDIAPPRSRKAEQSEATRGELVAAARRLFAERGYGAVGTEEIVRAAGVTRGALYHHFHGKKDLFRAVCEDVEREVVGIIAAEAEAAGAESPLAVLRVGAQAWLDACEDPAVQQIALLDAPGVLGWEEWREIGVRYGFGLIQGTLQAAIDAGELPEQPVKPLAHLILGAIDEAALLVARADDGGQTRREVGQSVEQFLEHMAPSA